MATVFSGMAFQGSVGDLTFYKLRSTGKIVVRQKGGPSKENVRNHPNFENTRRNNAEFGGRALMSKLIMNSLKGLKPVADYNIAGPINAMLRPIQKLDTAEWGTRPIRLSRVPETLNGFSLNRQRIFDSILRTPIELKISKETCTAEFTIPAIQPGINFHPNNGHPYYNIRMTLGLVSDVELVGENYKEMSEEYSLDIIDTAWTSVKELTTGSIHALKIPKVPESKDFTLVAAIGIRFGAPSVMNRIAQVKYAGSAKVVKAV